VASGGAERFSFLKAGRVVANVSTLRFFAAAFVCYSIVGSVMQTWLPYFLFHNFHTSLTSAGFSAAFYLQLPTAVGNLAGGALGDHFATRDYRGRMLVQAGSLLISAPFLLSMGMAGSITTVALSLAALGFLRAGWPPNVMAVILAGCRNSALRRVQTFETGLYRASRGSRRPTAAPPDLNYENNQNRNSSL
jgi:sugar phosphate permease